MKLTQTQLKNIVMQELKVALKEGKGGKRVQRGLTQAEIDQRNAHLMEIQDLYDEIFPAIQSLEGAMKRLARVDGGISGEGEDLYQRWMELRDRIQGNTSEGYPEEYPSSKEVEDDDDWSEWDGGEPD